MPKLGYIPFKSSIFWFTHKSLPAIYSATDYKRKVEPETLMFHEYPIKSTYSKAKKPTLGNIPQNESKE